MRSPGGARAQSKPAKALRALHDVTPVFMNVALLMEPDDAECPPFVDLTRELLRVDVLSDVAADADGATGDLGMLLLEAGWVDRVETMAFRLERHSTLR